MVVQYDYPNMKSISSLFLMLHFFTNAYSEQNHKGNSEQDLQRYHLFNDSHRIPESGLQKARNLRSQRDRPINSQGLDRMRRNRARWFKDEPYESDAIPKEIGKHMRESVDHIQ